MKDVKITRFPANVARCNEFQGYCHLCYGCPRKPHYYEDGNYPWECYIVPELLCFEFEKYMNEEGAALLEHKNAPMNKEYTYIRIEPDDEDEFKFVNIDRENIFKPF